MPMLNELRVSEISGFGFSKRCFADLTQLSLRNDSYFYFAVSSSFFFFFS